MNIYKLLITIFIIGTCTAQPVRRRTWSGIPRTTLAERLAKKYTALPRDPQYSYSKSYRKTPRRSYRRYYRTYYRAHA